MTEQFMKAEDFKVGATVRVGKGFTCLEEGSVHVVAADWLGTHWICCEHGYHYPLEDVRCRTPDGRLNEMFLVAEAPCAS